MAAQARLEQLTILMLSAVVPLLSARSSTSQPARGEFYTTNLELHDAAEEEGCEEKSRKEKSREEKLVRIL